MPGIDVCLQEIAGRLYDISFDSEGDILSNDAFDTAILVSLFAERRANESEVPEASRRRGWVGNEDTPGTEMGSKLWLYEQSRLTRDAVSGIGIAARNALQWLVDDGFADAIEGINPIPTSEGVRLEVVIRRPNSKTERRFYDLWQVTALPCPDQPRYIRLDIPAGFRGQYDIFAEAGYPNGPVTVYVRMPMTPIANNNLKLSSTLTTGQGWHPDSLITVDLISAGSLVIGNGGAGGSGGGNIGTGELGGGGGGGISFGIGGLSDDGLHNGIDGSLLVVGSGSAGNASGATATHSARAGTDGGNAIELHHDITVINKGAIIGGGGGGGGGGADIGTGGNGGSGGASGMAGTGTSPGSGGAPGKAVELNGHSVSWNPMGTILGDVS